MDVKSGYKPGTSDFLSIVLHMMKIWNFCSPKKSMQKHEPKNWPFSGPGHEFAYCTRAMWTLEKFWTHFKVLHSDFMITLWNQKSRNAGTSCIVIGLKESRCSMLML